MNLKTPYNNTRTVVVFYWMFYKFGKFLRKSQREFEFVDFVEKSVDFDDTWNPEAVWNRMSGMTNETLPVVLKKSWIKNNFKNRNNKKIIFDCDQLFKITQWRWCSLPLLLSLLIKWHVLKAIYQKILLVCDYLNWNNKKY